ncbi:MAG: LacI family DNA-binding transcriptional regulator [Anaerolineae bacterium]|jgi:LacI family transcriptional regulator
MATTKDVAQAAGVSITAASHVINGTQTVSETLTKRVLTALEALDYCSNILARSPQLGTTKTIGLVTLDNSNSFLAEIARHIRIIWLWS